MCVLGSEGGHGALSPSHGSDRSLGDSCSEGAQYRGGSTDLSQQLSRYVQHTWPGASGGLDWTIFTSWNDEGIGL